MLVKYTVSEFLSANGSFSSIDKLGSFHASYTNFCVDYLSTEMYLNSGIGCGCLEVVILLMLLHSFLFCLHCVSFCVLGLCFVL